MKKLTFHGRYIAFINNFLFLLISIFCWRYKFIAPSSLHFLYSFICYEPRAITLSASKIELKRIQHTSVDMAYNVKLVTADRKLKWHIEAKLWIFWIYVYGGQILSISLAERHILQSSFAPYTRLQRLFGRYEQSLYPFFERNTLACYILQLVDSAFDGPCDQLKLFTYLFLL